MDVSDKLRHWLESSNRPVGSVVHTLDGNQPIRAELTAEGWVFEKETWVYDD